jgi:translation initiation factor 4E
MPLWEDANNARGGKWMLRLKKGHSNRAWEDVILAMIGDIFELDNEICGIVLVTKAQEDILSVWNRNAHNRAVNLKIRDTLKRILGLTHNNSLEYRPHDQSIKNLHRNEHSQQQQQQHKQEKDTHSSTQQSQHQTTTSTHT